MPISKSLREQYKRIKENPIQIFPLVAIGISVITPIILKIFYSLPLDVLFVIIIILLVSMITYQFINCEIRVKDIKSKKRHRERVMDLYVDSIITKDEADEKIAVLNNVIMLDLER